MENFIEKFINKKSAMFFDAMQTGKTKRSLHLIKKWDCRKIVIIIPTNLNFQWINDINELFDNFKVIDMTSNNKIDKINEEIKLIINEKIFFICTYHFFAHKIKSIKLSFDCVVLDEAHNHKSCKKNSISWLLRVNSSSIAYKIAITGTPASNKMLDIWYILKFLYPIKIDNFFVFRNKYFLPEDEMFLGRKKVVTSYKINEISFKYILQFIQENSSNLQIEDIWDQYTEIKETIINVAQPKHKLMELENFISNYQIIYPNIQEPIELFLDPLQYNLELSKYFNCCDMYGLENVKVDFLKKIIKNNQKSKIIIYSKWAKHLKWLYENKIFDGDIYIHTGEIKQIEEFKKTSYPAILLMNPDIAAGHRLHDVDIIIYYALPWSPAKLEQSKYRFRHQCDVPEVKHIWYLILKNSFDKDIYDKIIVKKQDLDKINKISKLIIK